MLLNHLRQSGSSDNLLLFFNGWGMAALGDFSLFERGWGGFTAGLIGSSYGQPDVIEFYDYSELACPINLPELNRRYQNIYLLSWSLGVAAAGLVLPQELKLAMSVAVNGTADPISAEYGIAPAIFQGTIDNWSQESRTSFNRRICRGREQLACFEQMQPQRPVASQKQELLALQKYLSSEYGRKPSLKFDLAFIGLQDKIFLPQQQLSFWQTQSTKIITADKPHWPL